MRAVRKKKPVQGGGSKGKSYRFDELFANMRNSMAMSVLVHFLLLLIFIFVNAGFQMKTSDFAEISFVSGAPYRPSVRPGMVASETAPVQKEPAAQNLAVNLPRRRMLEDESPLLSAPEREKITPDLDHPIRADRLDERVMPDKFTREVTSERYDKKPPVGSEKNDPGTKESHGIEPFSHTGTDQLFSIEGDAARRTIVRKIIPQYPPGLQKEATIKVRFEVLPDGTVGNMLPMIKGEPTLEKLTLEALRQWQFNALPPALEQKVVTGIIAFRYMLR